MILEKQVTSLELSKRLKELGVVHESVYSWANAKLRGIQLTSKAMVELQRKRPKKIQIYDEDYSAFTASELLELLPEWCSLSKRDDDYHCQYFHKNSRQVDHSFDVNPVDCLAKMLIHLIENGLMK